MNMYLSNERTAKRILASEPVQENANTLQSVLEAAQLRFLDRNRRSQELHNAATKRLPGGNTRTQLHTPPFPVYMKSGSGFQVKSEDDHTYTDMVGEVTAGLYGHSHPVIQEAFHQVFSQIGINLGATHVYEHVYANTLCDRFEIDQVRFTNSGTEANLFAIAAARAFTGKHKVVVLSGAYHGGVLLFAGGENAIQNVDRQDWIIAEFNNIESVVNAIGQDDVAAVLVEGMQGGPPAVAATQDFLDAIQTTSRKANVIFILDEVMTSRFAPGGLASIRNLTPDIKTFGKYLGGGLAFGAFGGKANIMALYDPRSTEPKKIPHHGTFNNNLMTLYVGNAGLTRIFTPEVCRDFHQVGERLRKRLAKLTTGTKMCFTGMSTVLGCHFTDEGMQDLERETPENWDLKELFWLEMMEEGFWTTRRGYIALVLGTPEQELERFVRCVECWLHKHRDLVKV